MLKARPIALVLPLCLAEQRSTSGKNIVIDSLVYCEVCSIVAIYGRVSNCTLSSCIRISLWAGLTSASTVTAAAAAAAASQRATNQHCLLVQYCCA